MRTIWSLLRTELSAHAAALRTFAVVAIIISTANLAMGGATPAITVCVLTVAFLPSILFAQDERMHLDAIYSILPVTRSQFVVSRYLLVALVTAVMALASLVVARVEAAVHGPGEIRVPVSVPAVTGMAVAAVGAAVAVQLLLFFALGHARTGTYAYGATMVLMVGGGFLVERLPGFAAAVIRWAASSWTGPAGLGIAVVLLAVSAVASVAAYRRRSL